MAKNRYKVTDEKISLVFRLKNLSNDQRTIAKAVRLSQGTVSRILEAKKVEEIVAPKPSRHFNWKDFNNSIIL